MDNKISFIYRKLCDRKQSIIIVMKQEQEARARREINDSDNIDFNFFIFCDKNIKCVTT